MTKRKHTCETCKFWYNNQRFSGEHWTPAEKSTRAERRRMRDLANLAGECRVNKHSMISPIKMRDQLCREHKPKDDAR